MRYSTNPDTDHRKVVAWTAFSLAMLWFLWALIPFGIRFSRNVKDFTSLEANQRHALLHRLEVSGHIPTEQECREAAWDEYQRHFRTPWRRGYRGGDIVLMPDHGVIQVTLAGEWRTRQLDAVFDEKRRRWEIQAVHRSAQKNALQKY